MATPVKHTSKGPGLVSREKPSKGISIGFDITNECHGYVNKQDLTNLPRGFLVNGSQNVFVNTSGLIQSRSGYTLDGQAGTAATGILASYDWYRGSYGDQHLRAGNSKLQYRYVATAGDVYKTNTFTASQVFWIDLQTSLNSNYVEFAEFFDTTELLNVLLFVDRESKIYEWSGAVATISGVTSNTITITGTATWAASGFYASKSGRAVVINGNTYTYTGGETTTTLTGVSPSPAGEALQSVVHQAVVTTNNSAMTTLPSTFRNDFIGNLSQQIYVGSLLSNRIYISKISNYTNYSQGTPRAPGDGYVAVVDGLVTAIRPQETTMYVSWGNSGWTTFEFKLSADLTGETVIVTPLKVANLQAALSQGLITNIGNDLAFVTFEPTFSTMGRVANNLAQPSISNISDSIKNDFNTYGVSSFTDGHVKYTKYFIWVSVPQLGIVRRYNIQAGWWEPPFIMPIGRFSVVNGSIYGHSYNTDESYLLENGNNDNGNPIHCIAALSYDNFGDRAAKKRFEEWYVEGYIAGNTTLNAITKFDFGGFSGLNTYQVFGNLANDPSVQNNSTLNYIFQTTADGSLGKNPLGQQPIGSITDSLLQLPKFRIILTGSPTAFYEYQAYFETNDIDFQWAILAHGPRIQSGPAPGEIRK